MSEVLSYKLPEHLAARRSAKRREGATQLIAGVVAVACLVGAGFLLRPINAARKEHQFVIDERSIRGLPPDIALLGKMGTFRALAIDWAAIRAERLKQEGKTYEALQLYETICALAPRFPTVWVNAAWNMAYNISVQKYTPEQRWMWVRNGIEILRDKGIQYNPRAVSLYKELAWIYWHKIGDFLDDEHLNYKRALAVEMERILGPMPIVLDEEEYFDWFRKIVDAPRDLNALIKTNSAVSGLVHRLGAVELAPDESLLEFVARHFRPEVTIAELQRNRASPDTLTARRSELLRDERWREPLERLLAAVRSEILRGEYHMDVRRMMSLMEDQYGPLDWRNGFSHGLYWATIGDEIAEGHANISAHDRINTARYILNSLQSLVAHGRLTLWPNFDDPFSSYLELTPDTRFIPYLYDEYMRIGKKFFAGHPNYREGTPGPVLMTGFVTSLQNWIQLLYLEGGERNVNLAEKYFAWLREYNPHPDGSTQARYLTTLDEFVMGEILDQLQTYRAARAFVASLIQRGLKQFSLGLDEQGVQSLRRARQSYDFWMVDTRVDRNDRRKMQPFIVIVRTELESFLTARNILSLYKVRLWKHLPLDQRQMVYDRLLPYFERLCEAVDPPWDADRAFPQPPGMEEARRRDIPMRGLPREGAAEEGTRDRQ